MARPTKLTPEVQEAICDAIRHGATYWAAAESAGVSYAAFNEWRKDKRPKYIKFFNAVQQANADGQLDLLAKLEQAGKNDWRAAAWILERRHRKDYGANVDVTTDNKPVNITVSYEDKRNGSGDGTDNNPATPAPEAG